MGVVVVIFPLSVVILTARGPSQTWGCVLGGRNLTTKTPMTTVWNFLDLPVSDPRRFSGMAQLEAADNPVPNAPKPPAQALGIDLVPLLVSSGQGQHGIFQIE